MFYRKSITPDMPPPGYTDQGTSPEIITGVGKHPQWGGFALLIRKSANDMHTLVSVLEELE